MKDILLYKDHQKPLAVRIVVDYYDDRPKVIAIGGKSGVGKTEVANLVADMLRDEGLHTRILSQDNFYKAHYREDRKRNIDTVGKHELDWVTLNRAIANWKFSQLYNLIIIEGLYSLYADDYDIGYYISQSYNESYGFRKERGKEDPDCEFRHRVLDKEAKDVRRSKEKADTILTYPKV